jgi:hypothetical protein
METGNSRTRTRRLKQPFRTTDPGRKEEKMFRTDISITRLLAMDCGHDKELVESLWWDWFCPEGQLFRRGLRLIARLREIADSPLFDKHRYRTFFKNVCMGTGATSDHFCIVPMEEGSALPWFDICPPRGRGKDCAFFAGAGDGGNPSFHSIGMSCDSPSWNR